MCLLVLVLGPHQGCSKLLLPQIIWAGDCLMLLICCCSAIHTKWQEVQPWWFGRESHDPSNFNIWWRGVFFSRFASTWWHSHSKSMLYLNLVILVHGIKFIILLTPGRHKFSCCITNLFWVHEQGINCIPLPSWTGLLVFFILRPNCWSIWTWASFHLHGFCQHTRSVCIFDEPDVTASSISGDPTLSTFSDSSKLPSSTKAHTLWCHARVQHFCLFPWQTECWLLYLVITSLIVLQHLDSRLPLHCITLYLMLLTRRLIRVFLTGIGAAAHASLETEKLNSPMKSATVHICTSLRDY